MCRIGVSVPVLSSLCVSLSKVKVLYGGTELFDYEVRRTFHNDMLPAFISGACIALLVYILTSFSGTALSQVQHHGHLCA